MIVASDGGTAIFSSSIQAVPSGSGLVAKEAIMICGKYDFVTYVDEFGNEFASVLDGILFHLTGDDRYLLS